MWKKRCVFCFQTRLNMKDSYIGASILKCWFAALGISFEEWELGVCGGGTTRAKGAWLSLFLPLSGFTAPLQSCHWLLEILVLSMNSASCYSIQFTSQCCYNERNSLHASLCSLATNGINIPIHKVKGHLHITLRLQKPHSKLEP